MATDLFIHAAAHCFSEGEFPNALRDLSDLHLLLNHYCTEHADFAVSCMTRATELGLQHYVALALRWVCRVFEPNADVVGQWRQLADSSLRNRVIDRARDWAYGQVLRPNHGTARGPMYPVAEQMLYWRAHLLRMPLRLLLPHLYRKSLLRAEKAWRHRDEGEKIRL